MSTSIFATGPISTRVESFSGFNAVVVADDRLAVSVTKGEHSVTSISAPESALPYIKAYVVDSTLYVKFEDNIQINGYCDATVDITTPAVGRLECQRLANVVADDCFENTLTLHCIEAGYMLIQGAVDTLYVNGDKGSCVIGTDFSVNKFADISLTDASEAQLKLDGIVDATLVNGSTLHYWGNPTLRKSDISTDSHLIHGHGHGQSDRFVL